MHVVPANTLVFLGVIKKELAGKENNVADALSWDWHLDDEELTLALYSNFPTQMPKNFQISPLPSEISSWLISLLQPLPVSKQLRE